MTTNRNTQTEQYSNLENFVKLLVASVSPNV